MKENKRTTRKQQPSDITVTTHRAPVDFSALEREHTLKIKRRHHHQDQLTQYRGQTDITVTTHKEPVDLVALE